MQVVLEAGPNDLPWPDEAKSKENGVTVCALRFGCRVVSGGCRELTQRLAVWLGIGTI